MARIFLPCTALVLLTLDCATTLALDSLKLPSGNPKLDVYQLLSKLALSNENAIEFRSNERHHLEQAFNTNPTTQAALKQLCDVYGSNQPVNDPKQFSSLVDRVDNFLDVIFKTSTFRKSMEFLQAKELLSESPAVVLATLRELWFQPFLVGRGRRHQPSFSTYFCANQQPVVENIESSDSSPTNWIRSYFTAWSNTKRLLPVDVQSHNVQKTHTGHLVGSTAEFELAALTVCALTSPAQRPTQDATTKSCQFVIDSQGNEVRALIHMGLDAEGKEKVMDIGWEMAGGLELPTPDPEMSEKHKKTKSTKKPHKKNETVDADLQKLVDALWDADKDDRVSNSTITFDWGKHVDGDKDVSPNPLFANVSEAFMKRPIYKALLDIYNQSNPNASTQLFHPPVCTAEDKMDDKRRAILDTFLTTVTNTSVFKLAYKYLQQQNKTGTNATEFHNKLFTLWFGGYSRCEGTPGSSGWEHVFSGEYRDNTVDGQHYWVRYYMLEKAGDINYHGYYTYDENLIGTIQYTWNGNVKKIGGFLLRSSPAFDFSLFTVCSLTHSGKEKCKFKINSNPLYVTSFKQTCDSGTCLSTSFPGKHF